MFKGWQGSLFNSVKSLHCPHVNTAKITLRKASWVFHNLLPLMKVQDHAHLALNADSVTSPEEHRVDFTLALLALAVENVLIGFPVTKKGRFKFTSIDFYTSEAPLLYSSLKEGLTKRKKKTKTYCQDTDDVWRASHQMSRDYFWAYLISQYGPAHWKMI